MLSSHLLQTNKEAMTLYPEVLNVLNQVQSSPFFIDSKQEFITYENKKWPIKKCNITLDEHAIGYIFYGLGSSFQIDHLLNQIHETVPVLIIDSQIDLVFSLLNTFDYSPVFNRHNIHYMLDHPENLPSKLHQYLCQHKDLLQVQWLENEMVSSISLHRNDLFLTNVFKYYKTYTEQGQQINQPKERIAKLETFYQTLTRQSTQTHSAFELTCKKGCNECCKSGVGFDICVRPIEWEYIHLYLTQIMPEQIRQKTFNDTVKYLAKHSDYILKILNYFDQHMGQLDQIKESEDYVALTVELRKAPCPFLDDLDSCQIYSHRALPCRTFGNSYIQDKALSCGKDEEVFELIMIDERKKSLLTNFEKAQNEMIAINSFYPYGQALYIWLFTHLDLTNMTFIPEPQLHYRQFKQYLVSPQKLNHRIQQLKDCAAKLVCS